MRWRVDVARLGRDLLWACLVVAMAAYGAVVVRNVTDALVGIASHPASLVVVQRPNR
jgi:hypothetical protein